MVKGLFAAIIAFGALIVMAVFAAGWFRAEPSTFVDGLFFADGLLAFILAAAATLVSMLALIAVFAAFAIEEEPGHRRPAKPFSLMILLVALGLVFAAFWRAPQPAVTPRPAEPQSPTQPTPMPEPAVEPAVEPVPGAIMDDPAPPIVSAGGAGYSFQYAYPAIAGAAPARVGARERALDQVFSATDAPGRVRLCGRAFVAFAGSASEEGPQDRNDARARARATIAIDHASRWLDRQGADCVRPVLLGVDLGQHAPTGRAEGDGALTAYQREVIAITRDSAGVADRPDAAAALAELEAYLATPAGAAAVSDGRSFRRAPVVFMP